ncbi:MAG: hypothetical protein HC839_00150 [Leptolyngbyaceae cyanobacterium RM2_2_21]|nr:hypothetical protein [Leptolyngbyaceae cyanobacterium RM2_2_21]
MSISVLNQSQNKRGYGRSALNASKFTQETVLISDSAHSFNLRSQSSSAHEGTAAQIFSTQHPEGITAYLKQRSGLPELTAVELYQRLIEIYGEELDQEITSDVILTDIKSLVEEQLDQDNLWQTVAQEIWTNLVLRATQEIQRDLGISFLESLDWEEFNQILEQHLFSQDTFNLEDRIYNLAGYYAHTLALKIIQDLGLENQPVSRLKRQFKLKSYVVNSEQIETQSRLSQAGPIPEIPSEFPILCRETSTGEISFSDQFQLDLWQSDTRGIAYLRYHSKHNRSHYLEHYISSISEAEILPWEIAEQIARKFGLQVAKLQLILAAHAAAQASPWQDTFTLTASEIASALGWDSQVLKSQAICRSRIASIVYALSCLLIKTVWLKSSMNRKKAVLTPVSKLWEVLISPKGEFDWTTGRIESSEEIQFVIRPGLWVHNFMEQTGETAEQSLDQFGQIASTLLKLRAYRNELVLRLILYLMLDLRLRASDSDPYEYEVGTLLEAVLLENAVQEAAANLEQGQQLFEQWTQALEILEQLGWAEENSKTYAATDTSKTATSKGVSLYAIPYPNGST